jgi:hypothetical protein
MFSSLGNFCGFVERIMSNYVGRVKSIAFLLVRAGVRASTVGAKHLRGDLYDCDRYLNSQMLRPLCFPAKRRRREGEA